MYIILENFEKLLYSVYERGGYSYADLQEDFVDVVVQEISEESYYQSAMMSLGESEALLIDRLKISRSVLTQILNLAYQAGNESRYATADLAVVELFAEFHKLQAKEQADKAYQSYRGWFAPASSTNTYSTSNIDINTILRSMTSNYLSN